MTQYVDDVYFERHKFTQNNKPIDATVYGPKQVERFGVNLQRAFELIPLEQKNRSSLGLIYDPKIPIMVAEINLGVQLIIESENGKQTRRTNRQKVSFYGGI